MHRKYIYLALFTFLLLNCSKDGQFGSVIDITGNAQVLVKNSKKWQKIRKNTVVHHGDSLKTEDNSRIEIKFDKSTIKLEENTLVYISDSLIDKIRVITVDNISGGVLSSIHELDTLTTTFQVKTPASVAQAKGTHFLVLYEPVPRISHVNVFTGRVSVFNPLFPAPPILVPPGFFTTVHFSHGPVFPAKLNYGQLKKMQRILGPTHFKHYHESFKLHPSKGKYAPHFSGPNKHFTKDLGKMQKKGIQKGHPLILPVPVPVPGKAIHHKKEIGGKGKGKGKKH